MSAIEIAGASKHFGRVHAVNDLSFEVEGGRVTGFLGPNGAGKSTTLRILLGLIHADGGSATFGGRRYDELEHPSAQVGAVLENAGFHPGRCRRRCRASTPRTSGCLRTSTCRTPASPCC